MNVHISYKAAKNSDLEEQFQQQIQKLSRRLQVFKPDLVHLHGNLEENSARQGFCVSLNLRLPSGQLASKGIGDTPVAAIKRAFDDLIEQFTKHKDQLRSRYKWLRRQQEGRARPEPQLPFEETLAAVRPATVSGEDISQYVNVNLYRLVRFVERELRYRESAGQFDPDQVTREEIIDEAIANALGESGEKPDKLALEPWLYRLALRAIDEVAARNAEGNGDVSLDASARRVNVGASDEFHLQFHQPDEALAEEDTIADRAASNPEDIAASDEMTKLVEAALLGAKRRDREAFLLYAVEGFTVEEIAAISERKPEEVRKSVSLAREHLRKALPIPDEFKDKFFQHPRIA